MLEPADEQRAAAEVHGDRLACERRIRRILLEPGDPLHDVERPQARLESEVRPPRQLLGIDRVIRELLGCEVTNADVLCFEVAQQRRQPCEVLGLGVRNDVEVLGRAHIPVNADGDPADHYEPDVSLS
jgi:hypothetical protein